MPIDTNAGPIGFGGVARIPSGFASNFFMHPAQQKKYSCPA
jgi:hypothetical protein